MELFDSQRPSGTKFVLMPPHEDVFILHVFSPLGDIAFELVRGSGTG